jgi:hypothetical protein
MISYLFAHGSQPATVPCADFDREYDELAAKGKADEATGMPPGMTSTAGRSRSKRDLLGWEEAPDE